MKRKLKATPRFIVIIALVCFAVAATAFIGQNVKLAEIADKQAQLDEEYAALQAEEDRLEYMIEYAKSKEYLIQYAREKLGFVLPEDVKFEITE